MPAPAVGALAEEWNRVPLRGRCETLVLLLEFGESPPGIVEHAPRHARQLGHLDAVALARRALADRVQEHHVALVFNGARCTLAAVASSPGKAVISK